MARDIHSRASIFSRGEKREKSPLAVSLVVHRVRRAETSARICGSTVSSLCLCPRHANARLTFPVPRCRHILYRILSFYFIRGAIEIVEEPRERNEINEPDVSAAIVSANTAAMFANLVLARFNLPALG